MVGIRETTLAANQWLDEAKRFKFKAETSKPVETKFNPNRIYKREANGAKRNVQVLDEDERSENDFLQPEVSKPRDRVRTYQKSLRSVLDDDDVIITLNPMEIRTFVVSLEYKP